MVSKSTVKYIQSLQHKKFRDEYEVFVAEGPKVVEGILSSALFPVKTVYAVQSWLDAAPGEIKDRLGEKIEIVKDFELEKIAHYSTANKVVAVFEKRQPVNGFDCKNKVTIALDDIQDPGNLGTIIRTADWFGIENIFCSAQTVDLYNNKVVQSTMASLGMVNVVYGNLAAWIKSQAVPVYAAALNGKSVYSVGALKEAIVIIGNESKGINPELLELATERITIPKRGNAESLNAAVAAGIIMSQLVG